MKYGFIYVVYHVSELEPLTLVNFVESIDKCKMYEYRYTYKSKSYTSPPTEKTWNYETYSEIPGIWKTNDGQSFECKGGESYIKSTMITDFDMPNVKSARSFGVGCSDGPLENFKLLPLVINDLKPNTIEGKGVVCQNKPRFWDDPCPEASFSFRCYTKWNEPGNLFSSYSWLIFKFDICKII